MLDRSLAPAFSKKNSFDLPRPEVIKLHDNLDLVFLGNLQQDVFKLEIIFKAGKWYETKPGVSHFTSVMLDKGTAQKSSKQIAELFDYHGAQIEISPGYDFVSVSLYGLTKHFRELLPVFIEILTTPSLPQNELDLQKGIFIQQLEVSNKKNSAVASKLIRKNIFGGAHPYGNSIEKTDVLNLSQENLQGYFTNYFSAHEIYLIGNFDSSQVQWLVTELHLLKKDSVHVNHEFAIQNQVVIQNVTTLDSVQSSIRLGKPVINRAHPDYFALLLLNHILGGYFGSRLMKNIREAKGLTYGIYSSINPFKNDCMFSIGADVNKDKLELTISEIKKELESLSQKLIPENELIISKNHLLGSLQLEVANPFTSFDKIKNLRLNQLSEGYYQNLFSSVQAVSLSALQTTSQKYLSIDDLFEVTVG